MTGSLQIQTRSPKSSVHTHARTSRHCTLLSGALSWRDISDIRRDISDIGVLMQCSFRWIGSTAPAVLSCLLTQSAASL